LKKTKQKHLAPNFVSDERKNDDIPQPKKKKKTKKLNWESPSNNLFDSN